MDEIVIPDCKDSPFAAFGGDLRSCFYYPDYGFSRRSRGDARVDAISDTRCRNGPRRLLHCVRYRWTKLAVRRASGWRRSVTGVARQKNKRPAKGYGQFAAEDWMLEDWHREFDGGNNVGAWRYCMRDGMMVEKRWIFRTNLQI